MNREEALAKFDEFKASTPDTHDLVWHISPTGNRQGIERDGLKTSDPNKSLFWTQAGNTAHSKGVYVSTDEPFTAYHPDNDNHVFYGGDVYLARAPKLNIVHQAVSDRQFHEYVRTNVSKKNLVRIGHQAPYIHDSSYGYEPNEFHWGDEDKCEACSHNWSAYKQSIDSDWKNVEIRPNPEDPEGKTVIKAKWWPRNDPQHPVWNPTGSKGYWSENVQDKNEPQSADEEYEQARKQWFRQRGDGAEAFFKTARMMPGQR